MNWPKKYDFKNIEQKWNQYWEKEGIYNFDSKSRKPIFSVDTPPPTISSAQLHVGHAMSYSQAEFIVRYKRMKGYNIFYPMGFDNNGLPTERFVEKKYKIHKSTVRRQDFIKLCLKETEIGIESYKKLWKSLGISVDWSLTYSSIDSLSRRTAQLSFIELYNKGLIERKKEPIQWCPSCQTSLAQADIVMEERNSKLHNILFKSSKGDILTISTTRPELLPACVALYAHPDDSRYSDLKGKKAKVPLFNYEVPIKFDPSVDPDFGTGLMMVCTWGDVEDIKKWKETKLDTRITLNHDGTLNNLSKQYSGMKVNVASQKIISDLASQGLLVKSLPIKHNVSIHDRCLTPIEFMLVPQWFIKILEFKEQLLSKGEEVKWHPEFMKVRYLDWVLNLKWDWNISRQRYYGVPFPVWYCENCSSPVLAEIDSLPVDPTIDKPQTSSCPRCKHNTFLPENDVMDTWMTSSLSPLINGKWAYGDELQKRIYPMSLRPQGFEIIRTWFFYTIVKSYFHTNSIPWESTMISGWGLDKKGKKMSKSLGNFVAAQDAIDKYSADALRYWAAGATLGQDMRYSEDEMVKGKKLLTKLWNAARFAAQNIEKFNPSQQKFQLSTIDKWVFSKLQEVISQATRHMEDYEFNQALRVTEEFFKSIYCDNYLEIIKDRFWTPENYKDITIISTKNTMYLVFLTILKLFAHFLPFITEEIYDRFYKKFEGDKSIHLSLWPELNQKLINKKAEFQGELLLIVLKAVRKYKSSFKIHQNHWISELKIKCLGDNRNTIQQELFNISGDLKSASRAKKISFSEQANFETENPNIKISIILNE